MPFVQVEGGQIHYQMEGNRDLPVLVLSNSLGTNLSLWDEQMPAFTEHFQVLRYDSYGHGKSTFSTGGFQIERLGRDVIKLIDHLGLKGVHFCGLSVGGIVGQWLALNAGERFTKIALCNTGAKTGTAESWNGRIDAVNKGGLSSISQMILERWFTESFREREPATVDRFRKMIEATSAEGYVASCAALRDIDLRSEVSKIRTKTLVVTGTHDKAIPPESGRYLVEQIPGSEYVELDAAHLSNAEVPQQFSDAVVNFLVR